MIVDHPAGPDNCDPVGVNATITGLVHLIEQGKSEPGPRRLCELLERVGKGI
jgi:hypothetical protein